MINRLFFALITIILVQFCSQDKQIKTYRLQKNNLPSNSINIKPSYQSIGWHKPDKWIASKGSNMRLASFEVPFTVGLGDLSIIELNGNGGGIEANVNRWRTQLGLNFQPLQEIEKDIIIREGNFGVYQIINLINYQTNLGFLCAIIPLDNRTLFIKLSGTIEGINESKTDFISFSSSIHLSN